MRHDRKEFNPERPSFVLGAAQLGMPYGIANREGDLNQAQVDDVLNAAWDCGVRAIDSAASYGESERRIGSFLERFSERPFQVVSKLAGSVDPESKDSVVDSVERTRSHLGCAPWAILLHNPEHLKCWESGLGNVLLELKQAKRFERIGVSTYTVEQFDRALETPEIDCIQAPFSVFDQRLGSGSRLERALASGMTLFFRSIFLQGLLVMQLDQVEARFGAGSEFFFWANEWQTIVSRLGRSAEELAIGFVTARVPEARLILGCETVEQVKANAAVLRKVRPASGIDGHQGQPLSDLELTELSRFAAVPPAVYDPRVWPKT